MFGGNVEIPEWYATYKSAKMVAVESGVGSGGGEYTRPPIEGGNNEEFVSEEIADGIHDRSTDRLLRKLGERPDDTDPLRFDLQHSTVADMAR